MHNQGKIRQKAFFLKIFSFGTKKFLKLLFVFFILTIFSFVFLRFSDAYPFITPADEYNVVSDPRQATAADFDGDTDIDLAVVNYRSSNVSILLNNGDNTFANAVNYPSGGAGSRALTARDFDGDTDIDLAVVNLASNEISILINNGSGSFNVVNTYQTGIVGNISSISADSPPVVTTTAPHGFKIGDNIYPLYIEGNSAVIDGYYAVSIIGPDTFTLVDTEVSVPSGPGGTFKAVPSPSDIVSAHFNPGAGVGQDYFYDLAVVNSQSNNIAIFMGNGDGTFNPPVYYPCNSFPTSIISYDLNNDGNLDLAVTNNGYIPGFSILFGNGDGTFGSASKYDFNFPDYNYFAGSIIAGDFDSDSDLEIAGVLLYYPFVPGGPQNSKVLIYDNNGAGVFSPLSSYNVGKYASNIAAADFDADPACLGCLDLAVANFYDNTVSILTGNNDNTFDAAVNFNVGDGPAFLLNFDLDNDALADLITVNKGENNLNIFYYSEISNNLISYLRNNGVIIIESDNFTQVKEGAAPGDYGENDTYTVALSSAPATNVTITITTADSQTIALPSPLIFTPANYNVPQTVTVTAVDDADLEGPHIGIITHTAAGDPLFAGFPIPSVRANIIDDDQAGISFYESGGKTEVIENGATDTYKVVLNKQPTADVEINISAIQATAFPNSLIFTDSNWKVPQTVTLTAINDFYVEGSQQIDIAHVAASIDGAYNALNADLKNVNVIDNNIAYANPICPGILGDLNNDLHINAIDGDLFGKYLAGNVYNPCAKLDGASLYLGPADMAFLRTIIINQGDYSKEVVIYEKPYGSGTYVAEGGAIDFFQVFLQQSPAPGKQVVIDISFDANKLILDKTRLVFLPGDYWDGMAHEVTVAAYNDDIVEGADTDLITFTINPILTTDSNYLAGVPPIPSITAHITDNDFAGFNVNIIDNLTSEDGDKGSFSIVLTSQPTANVVIPLSSDNLSEGTLGAVSSLTITPANWNKPAANIVEVTGVDDGAVCDGAKDYNIITGNAVSGDLNYNGLNPPDIPMVNQDNDPPGIYLQTKDGVPQITTEAGGTLTCQFGLLSAPLADVTIPLSISDLTEGTLSGVSQIVISAANWNNPVANEVTITGVDDFEVDGDIIYQLITGDPVSLPGSPYDLLGAADVADPSITNLDNDIAGITVSAISGNTTESGATATFSVVLNSEPTADVKIGISSSDLTEGTVSHSLLIFTNLDWNTPQTVTVTGVDDDETDGNIAYRIIFAPAVSADLSYNGIKPPDILLVNLDNDFGAGQSGLYTPTNLTCQAIDITQNNTLIKTINWNFRDNNDTELGFRLYGTTLIREVATPDIMQIQEPDMTADPITGLLEVNQPYTRTVRAYNNSTESADSNPATCYTLANVPKQPQVVAVGPDSITIKLAANDGNPPETLYAIKAATATEIRYVNPDGSFSETESWHTYEEFGGDNGLVVTGISTGQGSVSGASVQIALNTDEEYCFSAKAKNGDDIETEYSISTCEEAPPPPAGETNVTAAKGVGINLAWHNVFGLFATAWAGNNLIIDANPLIRILSVLSWLLNIALIILLVILGMSLWQTIKHLKHKLHLLNETPKLIWSVLTKEAIHSYQNHALQSEEGIYNTSSYYWHKNLHNISQCSFLFAMLAAGLKLFIIGVLIAGLVNLNHSSLAQIAPYNQSGATVYSGDILSYIIEISNNITGTPSDAPVIDAAVTDNIDNDLENFTITSLSNCGNDYTNNSTPTVLSLNGIDVAVGTNCLIKFTAQVKAGREGNTITNQAQVLVNGNTILTNTTTNPIGTQIPTNANENINQPPMPPANENINQPLAPICGNGVIEAGENCDQSACAAGYECINCLCQAIAPININENINQPPLPPINENINQPIIVPTGEIQPPEIPLIGPIQKIMDKPEVEQTSQNIITPILIIVAALNTLPAVIIMTFYLLPWMHLVFLEPFLAFFRRKRKKWGVVYNSLTKMPIDLALVRLYNKETNKLVQTKVTDREGRYIIIAKEPGKYYLTVTKPGFVSPSSYLRGETQDTKYIDLYHGEVIEVTEKDAVITANIPVDPVEKKALAFGEVIRSYFLKNIRLVVSYIGMVLALIVVLIIPTVWTMGALIIHVLLFLLFRRFINPPKPKSWGIVYDQQTKAPLGQTIVRLFDTKFNKLLETQVTDSKGRYSFLVGKNEYQLLMGKPGYQTKEVSPVDLVKNEEIVNLDVGLEKS